MSYPTCVRHVVLFPKLISILAHAMRVSKTIDVQLKADNQQTIETLETSSEVVPNLFSSESHTGHDLK